MEALNNLNPFLKQAITALVSIHALAFVVWMILLIKSYKKTKNPVQDAIDELLKKQEKKQQ